MGPHTATHPKQSCLRLCLGVLASVSGCCLCTFPVVWWVILWYNPTELSIPLGSGWPQIHRHTTRPGIPVGHRAVTPLECTHCHNHRHGSPPPGCLLLRPQVWLTTRGGDLLFSASSGVTEKFEDAKLNSRGFGILDVGFKVGAG